MKNPMSAMISCNDGFHDDYNVNEELQIEYYE